LIHRYVLENLKHRKLRTGLSALSIGFQVTMILTVTGLSRGMLQDSVNRARGVGADIWLKPPGASAISLSGASMPQKMLEFFRSQPHVAAVVGTAMQPIEGISTITGIDYAEFTSLSGDFRYLEGGTFRGEDDIIIDEWYAEQRNRKVGDEITLLNHKWRVCGIVVPGKLSRLVVSRARLQDLTNSAGKISQALIKVDRPENVQPVIDSFKKQLPDYSIYSMEEFVSLFSVNNIPGLKAFIWVIITLSVVIGFLVVSLTMYTTVLERTREIGILKALGAAPADILGILIRETVVLAAGGWATGVAMSFGTNWAVNRFVRANLQSQITFDWWPYALAIAMGAALLGALYPGLRAARQDAIEALSYE
jgi:putative ABC transport system permease protein